ncbi:Polyketide synthase-nonribosomal peptide synthetase [Madurella mycetomatis]|uniref:Polyketide synthase-nonribosomal peptide synthetase n=1 Tax=Madurella mycetomatis TaxID=100816 RepID=A0A175WCF5_9PEZI|nr:Polyketide synthase-nonribosomal peptide synthetase [Madurella mycetomatis]
MSTLLQDSEKLANEYALSGQIDWTQETALQPELESAALQWPASSAMMPNTQPPRVIVLTGTTGFLEQHLLRALLQQDGVDKVICIANRNMTAERRRVLLNNSDNNNRVKCLEGGLCSPRLDLSQEDTARIFRTPDCQDEADTVVHNGADVSHLGTYASVRAANVGSTKQLAALCLPRRLPLHYVSTTSIAMYQPAHVGDGEAGVVFVHEPGDVGIEVASIREYLNQELGREQNLNFPRLLRG